MSAGCAEIRKPRKIGGFIHFGETGDEPNSFYFYFQHNKICIECKNVLQFDRGLETVKK